MKEYTFISLHRMRFTAFVHGYAGSFLCVSLAVPDMSVKGTLSALYGALDLSQYKLIRGLLSYNIGEILDDIEFESSESATVHLYKQVC
jgi:hypothetical protein